MKMKMKMKNRSHRYDINRSWPRHGHKYTKGTVRYLATEETAEMFQFLFCKSIIPQFIESVCKAIHDSLAQEHMK